MTEDYSKLRDSTLLDRYGANRRDLFVLAGRPDYNGSGKVLAKLVTRNQELIIAELDKRGIPYSK